MEAGSGSGSVGPRAENNPVQSNWVVGPSSSNGSSAQPSYQDSEETISEFSIRNEPSFVRRCKQKNYKQEKSVALGKSKCMQFVRAVMEGKGVSRRKGSSRREGKFQVERQAVVSEAELAQGGGFLRDEDEMRTDRSPHRALSNCTSTPASGLQLLLEEHSSLVPETPLPSLPDLSRKELDASRLYSLQKSNGFNFKVVDGTMVSRLAVL